MSTPNHEEFVSAIDSVLDEFPEYGKNNIKSKLKERYPNWQIGEKRVAKHLKSVKDARKSSGTVNECDITVPHERDSDSNQNEENDLKESNTFEDDGIFRVNNTQEQQSDNSASIRKESSDSKAHKLDTDIEMQSSRENDAALENALFGEKTVRQSNEIEDVPEIVTLEDMISDSPEPVETKDDAPKQSEQPKENGALTRTCSQLIKVSPDNTSLVIEDLITQEICAESGDTDSLASEESEPDTKTGIQTDIAINGKTSKEIIHEEDPAQAPIAIPEQRIIEPEQKSTKSDAQTAEKIITDDVFEGELSKEAMSESGIALPKTPSKGVEMYEDSSVTAKPKKRANKSVRDREAEVDTICRCHLM
uniref:AlNc14C94G5799 protein n=1 Tax=Albugo laibachii Nc14 TaxID=890382 RepID=F0WGS2_9STRA|nr:AlNc14C94G5799 [Albugo laibachii Nc14]|eukprot:CCA20436.1 AlNc14C94G5799 [Albugo laibachii Nc14]